MYQINLRFNQSPFFSFIGLLSCDLAKGHRGDTSKGRILGVWEVLKPNRNFTEHQRPLLLLQGLARARQGLHFFLSILITSCSYFKSLSP